METKDLAIKYRSLYQAAELMIANVEEIGFNTNEYKKELQDISHNVTNSIKENPVKGYARASYELDYSSGIDKLNN